MATARQIIEATVRRCAHRLPHGGRCSRPAAVTRNGEAFCSRHDPERGHNSLVHNGRVKARWVAEAGEQRRFHVEVTTNLTQPNKKFEVTASSFRRALEKAVQYPSSEFKVHYTGYNGIPTRHPDKALQAVFIGHMMYVRVTPIKEVVSVT